MESIDDKEDMQFADEAFDILGFTKEEKNNVYKVTAVVMHLGEIKFKARSSKDEQAVVDEANQAMGAKQEGGDQRCRDDGTWRGLAEALVTEEASER